METGGKKDDWTGGIKNYPSRTAFTLAPRMLAVSLLVTNYLPQVSVLMQLKPHSSFIYPEVARWAIHPTHRAKHAA